jgi:zinc/manganese transport system permease protein
MLMDLWNHEFMRNALLAGTGIAAASGVVGYFVVLRSQVFSTDALSHVAFTSALAALAAGVSARAGLFAGTIAVAIVIGIFAGRGRADDVVIGAVFTWVLGLGVLFLSIYSTSSSAVNGNAGTSVLFGSIFGLDRSQAISAALIGAGLCLAVACIARPLLLATIDDAIAAARGIPVRALGIGFLALVGVCAAEATQAVGALLLVGLIAAPAGAAQRLTDRPWRGLVLAAGIAIASMWIGLVASYRFASLPPSFAIMAIATLVYALTFAVRPRRARTASP